MTFACNFANHYPLFKTTLGNFIKDNITLRAGTHDYNTLFVLFECLILKPLKAVHIVSPIFIVIDALNGSVGTNNVGAQTMKLVNTHFMLKIS